MGKHIGSVKQQSNDLHPPLLWMSLKLNQFKVKLAMIPTDDLQISNFQELQAARNVS